MNMENRQLSTGAKPGRERWYRCFSFVIVFAIISSLAIVNHGRFFGMDVAGNEDKAASETVTQGDGMVINTTDLAADVTGYAGPVPVNIYVTEGKIDSVVALPNSESPSFFARLEEDGLTHAFDGKTLAEASQMTPDAATGATYSSKAYIANVKAGIAKVLEDEQQMKAASAGDGISWSALCALAVILAGAVIPLFVKDKRYRIVQQLLNVAILGFWAGTFIDYAMLENFVANGVTASVASVMMTLLFIIGFIYPIFGKTSHYCTWICPYGALQDLAGDCCKKKLHLSPALIHHLEQFRRLLWVVLLALLWMGWGTQWIDNEIFTAFIVESASWIVITVAALFIILSLFIPRPFCRFVCPTGTILRFKIDK